jgi:hypothetical protein
MPRTCWLPMLFLLLSSPVAAQPVTPPSEGGPPAGREARIGPAAGPANQRPRDDGPQVVQRGTDGSVVGLESPGATGTTPQGVMSSSAAGARESEAPMGGGPPMSNPPPDPTR